MAREKGAGWKTGELSKDGKPIYNWSRKTERARDTDPEHIAMENVIDEFVTDDEDSESIKNAVQYHPAVTSLLQGQSNLNTVQKNAEIAQDALNFAMNNAENNQPGTIVGSTLVDVLKVTKDDDYVEMIAEYSPQNGGSVSTYMIDGFKKDDGSYEFNLPGITDVTDDYDEFGLIDDDY